jgi:hypothetical protein
MIPEFSFDVSGFVNKLVDKSLDLGFSLGGGYLASELDLDFATGKPPGNVAAPPGTGPVVTNPKTAAPPPNPQVDVIKGTDAIDVALQKKLILASNGEGAGDRTAWYVAGGVLALAFLGALGLVLLKKG